MSTIPRQSGPLLEGTHALGDSQAYYNDQFLASLVHLLTAVCEL